MQAPHEAAKKPVDLSRFAFGSCPHWLPGCMVRLTLQQFEDWWGAPGVLFLCTALVGGLLNILKLNIHWTTATPVPLLAYSAQEPTAS